MLLKNCRLIPQLSGGYAGTADVLIRGDRIARIAPVISADGEQAIDCCGGWLLPGFIDLHTHLTGLGDFNPAHTRLPALLLSEACDLVRGYLDYGFTTIRDCGSCLRVANDAREMVRRGLVDGPRVLSCGQAVSPTENSVTNEIDTMDNVSDGPEAVRRAVREELAEQADFIKIYASGSAFNPKGKPLQPIMMADEIRAAVETAQRKGTYVAAHAHCDEAIRLCAESGVRTIEHATYLSEATQEAVAAAPECYLIPTLAAMYCNPGNDSPFWLERLGAMLKACGENLGRAYRAGLKIGFGTDSIPGRGQYAHGIEFRYRKEYMGCENIDILLQATRHSAEIAGLGDEIGSVREGYQADLVLVEGDPVADISVLYHKPALVLRAGRLARDNRKED